MLRTCSARVKFNLQMAPGLCGLLLMVIWRSKSSVVLRSISHADIVVFSLVWVYSKPSDMHHMTPGDNFSCHHALLLLGKLQFGSGMTIYRFWDMLQETCTVVVDSFFSVCSIICTYFSDCQAASDQKRMLLVYG